MTIRDSPSPDDVMSYALSDDPLVAWTEVWDTLRSEPVQASDLLFVHIDERGMEGGGSQRPFPKERRCFSAVSLGGGVALSPSSAVYLYDKSG